MKICHLLALLSLIPLLQPQVVLASPPEIPLKEATPRLVLAYTAPSPITTVGNWPKAPRITYKRVIPVSVLNCVSTLKSAGLLPQGPVTKDGQAATIPVKPLDIKEGEKAVIRTAEGPIGHVLQIELKNGKYISTVEGGYANGVGRTVNPAVIVGQVIVDKTPQKASVTSASSPVKKVSSPATSVAPTL